MSGYCHTRQFNVLYADCDEKDELKPSAFLTYGQEVAGSSAEELGFGYDDLISDNMGFLVVSVCCEILRPARPKSVLTLSTWPLPPRRFFFERQSVMEDEEGRVATLAARWCLLDFKNQKLLPPEALKVHPTCPYNPRKEMEADFSVPKMMGEGREVYSLVARPSHCDHFHHVNNTKYADFFMDCFTEEELKARRLKAFRIVYSRQVHSGEKITFFRKDVEGGSVLEARAGGEPTTRFLALFGEDGA